MLRYLLVILFFGWCFSTDNMHAQVNLVPNGNFEDSLNCPGFSAYMTSFPWFNPNHATPDFFKTYQICGISTINNNSGYQVPVQGDNYIGLYFYQFPEVREYIEVELTNFLIYNHIYRISYFVSLANEHREALGNFNACFSDTIIYNSSLTDYYLNCNPIELNPTFIPITDTMNWVLVSGTYIANGGEKYLTIGNFHNDSSTTIITANPSSNAYGAYYYVDSVSVTDLGLVGINDVNFSNQLQIVPNPVSSICAITSNENDTYALYSSIGQLIKVIPIMKGENTLDFSDLSSGIYLLKPQSYKQESVTFIKL